jgi:8-oxo-dGTP pyrophosphatase MutT (NUDIX family)
MLAYHVVDYVPYQPDVWAREGLYATGADPLRWQVQPPTTNAPVVVVDTTRLPTRACAQGAASSLPPEALCNVAPYRPPVAMRAAGGYVVPAHPPTPVPTVCAIYRRGAWDLPKGKQDAGESVVECALREVREEIGIKEITLHAPLGITSHGYATAQQYAVKTTHWFLMRTPACTFAPQAAEGIRRATWARWPVLHAHIGYASLRRHMETVAPRIAHLYTA